MSKWLVQNASGEFQALLLTELGPIWHGIQQYVHSVISPVWLLGVELDSVSHLLPKNVNDYTAWPHGPDPLPVIC